MSLNADLASLSSTIDQMIERVDAAVDALGDTERDDLLGDLYEVERHLRSANRRVRRAIGALPPG